MECIGEVKELVLKCEGGKKRVCLPVASGMPCSD